LRAKQSIEQKNILATVQAAVHLTHADTVEEFRAAIRGRIQSLANVHTLFIQSRWSGAKLCDLVNQELAPYREGDDARVDVEGPDLVLEPNVAQIMGVIFHELATNAAKYGALSVNEGRIVVSWTRAKSGRLVLHWTETGGPAVMPPARAGFGTRAMARMIEQADGELHLDWRPAGLACEITIPI
jgi:two-component sensor histidine kinase